MYSYALHLRFRAFSHVLNQQHPAQHFRMPHCLSLYCILHCERVCTSEACRLLRDVTPGLPVTLPASGSPGTHTWRNLRVAARHLRFGTRLCQHVQTIVASSNGPMSSTQLHHAPPCKYSRHCMRGHAQGHAGGLAPPSCEHQPDHPAHPAPAALRRQRAPPASPAVPTLLAGAPPPLPPRRTPAAASPPPRPTPLASSAVGALRR